MSVAELIGFLVLTGAAAYAQTLTGFAFRLIPMGGVGLTGLLSLPDAAMIVSVLTLVNATQMLLKGWRDVAWREFGLVMAASIPLLFVGYWLLEWLARARPVAPPRSRTAASMTRSRAPPPPPATAPPRPPQERPRRIRSTRPPPPTT